MNERETRGAPKGNRNAAKETGLSKRLPAVRVSEATHATITAYATANGMTVYEYVKQLIEQAAQPQPARAERG